MVDDVSLSQSESLDSGVTLRDGLRWQAVADDFGTGYRLRDKASLALQPDLEHRLTA